MRRSQWAWAANHCGGGLRRKAAEKSAAFCLNSAACLHTTQSHALALRIVAYQFHRRVREKLEPLHVLAGVHLTCRERQCLSLIAEGKSFSDVAIILGIAPRTVKDYVDSAKEKFGVRSSRDAATIFKCATHEYRGLTKGA